ncbi:hypothetical protein MKX01_039587 [Papaver californicum]|nr:hypothetical protein MKX01_039587 [Papaver californicum]
MTAIEEMAGMDVLCSDKTGTLTLNKLSVDKALIEVLYPRERKRALGNLGSLLVCCLSLILRGLIVLKPLERPLTLV